MKDISFTTLRLLLAAAQEGNLARAAERENIALSAISRRISDLEARLGVALLVRHDRGVSLTPNGELLLGQVQTIVEMADRLVSSADEIRGGGLGRVRIEAHMSAASGALPQLLASFLAAHPGIEIEVEEKTSLEILHAVQVGICDVGLVSGTVDAGDLQLTPWLDDELVAALPPESPLQARTEITLNDLLGEPFIGMQRGSALLDLYRHHAAAVGARLRVRAYATSFESVRKMVEAGLGVAILPAVAAYPFAREGGLVVRPLRETWAHRPLAVCTRNLASAAPATRLLVAHLASAAEPGLSKVRR
jgi:DNA-binding transcriptional LysR family regulator